MELTGLERDFMFGSRLRSPLTGAADIFGVLGTVGVGFQLRPAPKTLASTRSFQHASPWLTPGGEGTFACQRLLNPH